jgi:hypothetical protein
MKRIFTLSLVATMLAGMTMMSALEPAQAQSCNGNFQGNRGGRWNTASAQYGYNNGRFSNRYNNGFNNSFNNQFLNNSDKRARKLQRKAARQIRQQQMAAAGIPFGNGAVNNAYLNNVNYPYGMAGFGNGGACANGGMNNNVSYNAGYTNGYSDAVTGGGGFLNGNLNGNLGLNGIGGLGLNNLGMNGYGYGGGVSSLLGRVLNRF